MVEKSGKSESSADKLPWKYTSDGSITGTLGGEKKKPVGTSGQSALVSQTDILKDKLTLERVKPPKNNFQASPKINIGRPIKKQHQPTKGLITLGVSFLFGYVVALCEDRFGYVLFFCTVTQF